MDMALVSRFRNNMPPDADKSEGGIPSRLAKAVNNESGILIIGNGV